MLIRAAVITVSLESYEFPTFQELAAERQAEEDSLIGQLGLTEHVEKAKTFANSALESVKGFLPFGK